MRQHLIGVAALLLALGIAAPASAYVPSTTKESGKPLHWMHTNCVVMRPSSVGSADISDGSEFVAMQHAVDNWHKAISSCSFIRFELKEPAPSGVVAFDRNGPNENAIVFVESNWHRDKEHDDSAAGLTTVYFVDNKDSAQDGRILDADIELNGEFFKFATTGAAGRTDVENTVTHELGHVLGLDHPCDDGSSPGAKDNTGAPIPQCYPTEKLPAAMKATTMYNFAAPGETKKRTPEDDDILGICQTYPKADDPGQCAPTDFSNSGGCTIAPGSSTPAWPRGLGVLAVLLALGVMARRPRRQR